MPAEVPIRIKHTPEGKVTPVADLFKDGGGTTGAFFTAIGREQSGEKRFVKIGSATVKVHSERLGVVTVRDKDTGVNESVTYGTIRKQDRKDGPSEVTLILPPRRLNEKSPTVFEVVDLTPIGAIKRQATAEEVNIVRDQDLHKLLVAEPSHDISHPIFWLERLSAAK